MSTVLSSSRGALIVLEGCDHSGKTTQCKKLVSALNEASIKAEFYRFPGKYIYINDLDSYHRGTRTTAIGEMISGYLGRQQDIEDHAVHLLFSANRWELKPKMLRSLEDGTNLIVDRYAYSGVAFTAAKEGFDIDWCKQPDIGLPQPDAVFYLHLNPEVAAKRATFGGERYEQTDFQSRVSKNFDNLQDSHWTIVDADKTVEELHEDLLERVKDVINNIGNKPIGKLWTDKSFHY
ncbi:hypothetical protein FSP39_011769 [Pinctada imbricata]|uniref:Thymidylate kinase n=1 Tax=Pinctada imbricata TaxID=66713 RepID=A0AA89BTH7_PINIB|nr:hypothetical protein FSP39_011769 [Pinctada imbricata]